MLASKLLRPPPPRLARRRVNRAMDALRDSYRASLEMMLGPALGSGRGRALVAVIAVAAAGLFVALPSELVPNEDRGRVDIRLQGPEGAGYDYMAAQAPGRGAHGRAHRTRRGTSPPASTWSACRASAAARSTPATRADPEAPERAQRLGRRSRGHAQSHLSNIGGAR
jgi:hypothetical protein